MYIDIYILTWNQHGCCAFMHLLCKNHSQQPTFSHLEVPNTSSMRSWQFPSSTFLEWRRFLFTFFNVSDHIWHKNDQIEMKLHREYDYECIRNSYRIHYFPSKQWLAIDPTWPALKVNNAWGFDIISWSVWVF